MRVICNRCHRSDSHERFRWINQNGTGRCNKCWSEYVSSRKQAQRRANPTRIGAERQAGRPKPGELGGKRDPVERLLKAAKYRARQKGIPFELVYGDVYIPDVCPVLGIPLIPQNAGMVDNAPSLDRLDSTKGYVRGNVYVISWRANKLKSDATLEELEAIVKYVRRESSYKWVVR